MSMSMSIPYHHWVEWSPEDSAFIGYCPDLFMGGACHGSDEAKVYARLMTLVREEIKDLHAAGKPMPAVIVRPMRELAAV